MNYSIYGIIQFLQIAADPEGKDFPWYPQSLPQILSGPVLKHGSGDTAEELDLATAIKGKVLGIYFSAHWVCVIDNESHVKGNILFISNG